MDTTCTTIATHGEPHSPSDRPRTIESARRRTLGTCAHCHRPVRFDEEYVRLYRRAWHLECALASGPAVPAPGRGD